MECGMNNRDEMSHKRKHDEFQEVLSLKRIINAYMSYPKSANYEVNRWERSFNKLPAAYKDLLPLYPAKFETVRRCILENSRFIARMLEVFEPQIDMSLNLDCCCSPQNKKLGGSPRSEFAPAVTGATVPSQLQKSYTEEPVTEQCSRKESNGSQHNGINSDNAQLTLCCNNQSFITNNPMVESDKVRCIIRNIVRDWAEEGQEERNKCYGPILKELNSLFPHRHHDSPPKCLVAGAGLARLALEISNLGFVSQGNEFSYYMLICSGFILNHTERVGEWTIYPWIHDNCNSLADSDQLRPVSIPDVLPGSTNITEGFSMCAGDFVEVYNEPSEAGAWDAVVTCFFIDTAHNIIEYIETISKTLKDGGVWINLGPLLYHFADSFGNDDMSIELSLEDVKRISSHFGFVFEKESMIETTYTANCRLMMQTRYTCAFWTARKAPASRA